MHRDTRDLVNQLFAAATARLEDAIDPTVAGQSSKATAPQLRRYATQLARMADELGHLARTAAALARPDRAPRRRKKPSE